MRNTKVYRDNKENLPKSLPIGEIVFANDTCELFIGQGEGKDLKKVNNEDLNNIRTDVIGLNSSKRSKSVKLTKQDMDTSSDSVKLGLNNLSEEVHRALSGNASVNPTIPNGSITTEKLAQGSVKSKVIDTDTLNKLANYSQLKGYTRNFAENQDLQLNLADMKKIVSATEGYLRAVKGKEPYANIKQGQYYEINGGDSVWSYLFLHYRLVDDLVKYGKISIAFKVIDKPVGSEIAIAFRDGSDKFVPMEGETANYYHCEDLGDNWYGLHNLTPPQGADKIELRMDARGVAEGQSLKVSEIVLNGSPTLNREDIHLKKRVEHLETEIDGATLVDESVDRPKLTEEINKLLEKDFIHSEGDTFNYAINEDFDLSLDGIVNYPINAKVKPWFGIDYSGSTLSVNRTNKYYCLTTGDSTNSYLFFRYVFVGGLGERGRISLGIELKGEPPKGTSFNIRFETTNNAMAPGTVYHYFKRVGNMMLIEDLEIPENCNRVCIRIDGRSANAGSLYIGKIFVQNSSRVIRQDPNFKSRLNKIEETAWIEAKHMRPQSIEDRSLSQSALDCTSKHGVEYMTSLLTENTYDVIAKGTNHVTSNSSCGTLEVTEDGYYVLPSKHYHSYYIATGRDFLPHKKPISIKIKLGDNVPSGFEIVARHTSNGTKHKFNYVNGYMIIHNLELPESSSVEILIDNRYTNAEVLFKDLQVFTGPMPSHEILTLQSIQKALNTTNFIVGGDGSKSITEMRLNALPNCIEVRATSAGCTVDTFNKQFIVSNDSRNGYLFFYFKPTDGLDPGNVLTLGMDVIERNANSTLYLRFHDAEGRQIGNTRIAKTIGNKWCIIGEFIPMDTAKIEIRIDNRGAGDSNLVFTNLELFNTPSFDRLIIPEQSIDFNKAEINLNMFTSPSCTNLEAFNFRLANPQVSITDMGLKFQNNENTTNVQCIGVDITKGFEVGKLLPYKVNISETNKVTSSYEFDFNIIFFDINNKELGRVERNISAPSLYSGDTVIPENTHKVRLRFDINGQGNSYTINHIYLGGSSVTMQELITRSEVDSLIQSVGNKEQAYYVSLSGKDTNNGLSFSNALATVQKAIDLGATLIYVERGKYNQSFDCIDRHTLRIYPYGNNPSFVEGLEDIPKVVFSNAIELEDLVEEEGLLTKEIEINSNRFKSVFIDKTMTPMNTGTRPAPNATIWAVNGKEKNVNMDVKLTPVLTLEECKNTKGSLHYNGSKLYINPPQQGEITKYMLPSDNSFLGRIRRVGTVDLQDIVFEYGYRDNAIINNVKSCIVQNCECNYSIQGNGFNMDNTNGQMINCKAYRNRNDGFNFHGFGDTAIINCTGFYNYDDGISHHDGCTGYIQGGKWYGNGKAGIIPSYGCVVNTYNAECFDNAQYGYAIISSSGTLYQFRDILVQDLVCYRNPKGIAISTKYNALISNCVTYDNTVGIDIGSSGSAKIENCVSYDNGTGLQVSGSGDNVFASAKVSHCKFSDNKYGVRVMGGNKITIDRCNILYNTVEGFAPYSDSIVTINKSNNLYGNKNDYPSNIKQEIKDKNVSIATL